MALNILASIIHLVIFGISIFASAGSLIENSQDKENFHFFAFSFVKKNLNDLFAANICCVIS